MPPLKHKHLAAALASVLHEDYARELISEEELHFGEVDKMLRTPGSTGTFSG